MRVPTLVGIGGHFQGEVRPLEYGKPVIVGRSRTTDISLRRTSKYREESEEEREADEIGQMVSGRHFRITAHSPNSIEIKNLSVNGTKVDGQLIDTAVITDLAQKSHLIQFGFDAVFKLEMRELEDE